MLKVPTNFFLNNELHKKLRVIRSENILVAWNYPSEQRLWVDYSLVKKSHQKAYTTSQAAELIEKDRDKMIDLLNRNLLSPPSGRSYSIPTRKLKTFYWSEDDVLNLRDEFYKLIPKNKYNEPYKGHSLISKAELLAKMREDSSLYVKNQETGEFVKVWKAE